MFNKYGVLICAIGGALALSACSDETKQDLGLVKTAPDEFAVVARAPLSVPPDYSLRPPMPGAQRPMETSPRDSARQTVFGEEDMNRSAGQQPSGSFMDRIGANQADPSIRTKVDQETAQGAEDTRSTASRLMFWKDAEASKEGTPIDPVAERERLQQEGQTRIIKRNEDVEAP